MLHSDSSDVRVCTHNFKVHYVLLTPKVMIILLVDCYLLMIFCQIHVAFRGEEYKCIP